MFIKTAAGLVNIVKTFIKGGKSFEEAAGLALRAHGLEATEKNLGSLKKAYGATTGVPVKLKEADSIANGKGVKNMVKRWAGKDAAIAQEAGQQASFASNVIKKLDNKVPAALKPSGEVILQSYTKLPPVGKSNTVRAIKETKYTDDSTLQQKIKANWINNGDKGRLNIEGSKQKPIDFPKDRSFQPNVGSLKDNGPKDAPKPDPKVKDPSLQDKATDLWKKIKKYPYHAAGAVGVGAVGGYAANSLMSNKED